MILQNYYNRTREKHASEKYLGLLEELGLDSAKVELVTPEELANIG